MRGVYKVRARGFLSTEINHIEIYASRVAARFTCYVVTCPLIFLHYIMSVSSENSTGYGRSKRYDNLIFNGDEDKYKMWEVKMLAYMHLLYRNHRGERS